jgi:hypothetical protein
MVSIRHYNSPIFKINNFGGIIMNISASMVKELREMTGAGMMDCKKALTETAGENLNKTIPQ